jgi:hypothetical protein
MVRAEYSESSFRAVSYLVAALFGLCVTVIGTGAKVAAASSGRFTFAPASVTIGSTVKYSGAISRAQLREMAGSPPIRILSTVLRESGCVLFVKTPQNQVHIDRSTLRVSGSFVVGKTGVCKGKANTHPVEPGVYTYSFGCVACDVGNIRVVASSPSSTRPSLPFTGAPTDNVFGVGVGVLAIGVAFQLVGARRRPRRWSKAIRKALRAFSSNSDASIPP